MILQELLIESKITDDVISLLKRATANSEYENKIFIVGGFVRDKLLGRDSKDIDLVVDGSPMAGLEAATFIAKKLGIYKEESNPVIFPTYYTAKLSIPTKEGAFDVEFVAPRKEKYTPGSRKPSVERGTLKDDIFRRDFTINSLMMNLHSDKIVDLTGNGIPDLHSSILRTTGDMSVIFAEDPLRILRAVRFAIKYDLKMAPGMVDKIHQFAAELKNISTERINDEINKILVLKQPSKALELFKETGILKIIMPELQDLVGLGQTKHHDKDAFGHTLTVLDQSSPELIKRLAALFHDIGKAATRTEVNGKVQFIGHHDVGAELTKSIMKRLKYPNEIIEKVAAIVKHHMDLKNFRNDASEMKDSTLRMFIYRVGHNLEDALDVMQADNMSHAPGHNMPDQINKVRERINKLDVNQILNTKSILDGNEIMQLGAKGPLIGQIKNRILDHVIKNPGFTRQQAEGLAKNMIADSRKIKK